jgi:hypothetical protein
MRESWRRRMVMALLLGCTVLGLAGCSRQSQAVSLGPKPAVYAPGGAQADMSATVDEMRAWLTSLPPQDAANLQRHGRVTFTYQSLQTTDAAHAELIARYANDVWASAAAKFRGRGVEQPALVPQEVSFVQSAPDAYELTIVFAGISGAKRVPLSDPVRPTGRGRPQ